MLGPTIKLKTPVKNKLNATRFIGLIYLVSHIMNIAINAYPPVMLKNTKLCRCIELVKSKSLKDKIGS